MADKAAVVIIGAGVMGASVAYHLATRGVQDVMLLEQAPTPVGGSTARSAAGVRHQFSTPTNVRLSLHSITRLRNFADEVGGDAALHQVGYLFTINNATDWQQYQRNVAMQHELGVRVELLSPEEAARYVPGLRCDDLVGATYGPDDGYCDARGVALGYLHRAQELGVTLQCDTTVTSIVVRSRQVSEVVTSKGAIHCDIVVNAAGPWAGQVAALAGLDVPVRPVRRSIFVTEPFPALPKPIPLTIDVGSGFWMRKEGPGVLLGLARRDEPSSFNTEVDWSWLPTVETAGRWRCPSLTAAKIDALRSWAGLYEVTPDANPILGRHPELTNYVDISGFSGHGIMHSPAAGLLMAEEIIDGRAHTIPVDDLRISRFTSEQRAERAVF